MSLGTILLIVLVVILVGVLPTWGTEVGRWCWTARVILMILLLMGVI